MSAFILREEVELHAKVILLGDAGVGKTCFLKKFVEDTFQTNHIVTIGVDYKEKTIERSKFSVRLHLWDTAGEERFRSFSTSIFANSDACFLFYDVADKTTFDNLSVWKTMVEKINPSLLTVLVGTKLDMQTGSRKVPKEDAVKLAQTWGVQLFEISAKSGENIEPLIVALTDKLAEKKPPIAYHRALGAMEGRKRGLSGIFRNLTRRLSVA